MMVDKLERTRPIMPFEKVQRFFPLAVLLHNAEEAVTMPPWVRAHRGVVPFQPRKPAIWGGLLVLTVAAFAVTYLSARKGKQSVWAYLLFGYAAAMLANVFLPHLAVTVFFRGYTPGVVTAVLINVPLMSILLLGAVRERWVSGGRAIAYCVLVPLALSGAIMLLFAVA